MRGRRPLRSAAAVAVGAGLVVVGLASSSGAAVGFSATASAYGSRVQLTVTQAPLVPELIDAGGPTADAALDSLGTARSLAAFPYPGELLLALPGLVAGIGPQAPTLLKGIPEIALGALPVPMPPEVLALLNQIDLPYDQLTPAFQAAPPLPPYPFAAQAPVAGSEDRVELGIGVLEARADGDEVSAVAASEPGTGGVELAPIRSTARVVRDGDRVVAEARSVAGGLRIGPLLLGSVESSARMELGADGEVTSSSDFVVRGLQVGALTVDLTADGFSVGGVPVPVPIADTLSGILSGAGFELQVLREETTDTGVVSGALQITYPISFAGLPAEVQGLGEGLLTVTIGQSIATLTGSPIPELASGVAPSVTDGASFGADTGIGPGTGPLPVAGPAGSLPSSSATDRLAPVPVASRPGALPVELFDARGTYLVIIGSALLLSGSGGLLHTTGFRARPPELARPEGNV